MESLHPSFLKDLKCLFDILDADNQGCVSLTDIEHYWKLKKEQGDVSGTTSMLPNDFIDSLRKVAHGSGLLSFQRFCSGIKIALCKEQTKDLQVRLRPKKKLTRPRSYIKAVGCDSDEEKEEESSDGTNEKTDQVVRKSIISEVLPECRLVSPELEGDVIDHVLSAETNGEVTRSHSGSPSSTEERKNAKNELFNSIDAVTTDGMGIHEGTMYSLGLINGYGIERGKLLNIPNKDSRSEGSGEDNDSIVLRDMGNKMCLTSSCSSLSSSIISSEDQLQAITLENIDDEIVVLHEGLDSIQRAREWFLKRIAALQEEKICLEKNQRDRGNSYSLSNTLEGRRKELNIKTEDLYCYLHRITDFNDSLDKLTIPPSKVEQRRSLSNRSKLIKSKELSDELLHKKLKDQKEQMVKLEQDKVELVRELFQTRLKMSKLQDGNNKKAPMTPF